MMTAIRSLAVLAAISLAGCTTTMKYHMAANQVQAEMDRKQDVEAWSNRKCLAAPNGCQIHATEETIDDCAAMLGADATVVPSLAVARQDIEACLVRQGFERTAITTFHRSNPPTPCTDVYPFERCPLAVEPTRP